MYNLAIIKCTSPPLLARGWKFSNENWLPRRGSKPRTCWTRGRHATIWASAANYQSFDCDSTQGFFLIKQIFSEQIVIFLDDQPSKPWLHWNATSRFDDVVTDHLENSTSRNKDLVCHSGDNFRRCAHLIMYICIEISIALNSKRGVWVVR